MLPAHLPRPPTRWRVRLGLALLLALPAAGGAREAVVHHALDVTLDAARAHLQVRDRLQIPAAALSDGRVALTLNAGFTLSAVAGAEVERREAGARLQVLTLRVQAGGAAVTIGYAGRPVLDGAGRGEREWLDRDGAHLGAGSAWYPRIAGALHTFDLAIELPSGWRALAPGRVPAAHGGDGTRWTSERAVEDIDLVAGPFHVFRRATGWGDAQVWLRADDHGLAATYLDAVAAHVPFYAQLIGAYPYSRFTVVENLRETGWGMPGFTLLGARVMRLPFIPHTSLPHEVLHNWWGNGMLVDHRDGNWSEGLTAYLADHLLAQRRGDGARQRRDALARFRSAAGDGAGTAPVAFRARHDRRSQAVGYDKPLMIVHMARRARGDDDFKAALRAFYAGAVGRRVGARELLAALAPAGEDWFAQWWSRPGAPELALECCEIGAHAGGARITGRLRQVQAAAPFPLRVPVQVLLDGEAVAREHVVVMDGAHADFAIDVPGAPLALQIDGGFDLMRIPHADELPPALGELLGARGALAVLAPALPPEMEAAYRALAGRVGARVVDAAQAAPAPALWVLGRDAPLAAPWRAARARDVPDGDSRVVVARDGAGRSVALVDARSPAAAAALAARLPHYGRHGLLGFSGDDARAVFTGEAAVGASPLRVTFAAHGRTRAFALAPERALSP